MHPHLQTRYYLSFDVPIEVARARLDATRTLDKFEQENSFFQDTRNDTYAAQENFLSVFVSLIRLSLSLQFKPNCKIF